jgi:hypothetical protein
MSTHRGRRAARRVAVALLLAPAVPATGARAAEPPAAWTFPPSIDLLGSRLLQARATDAGYRLMVSPLGGVARTLPVSAIPFVDDVDLGTEADGRAVAVYARCADDERQPCRLFEYVFATEREHRLLNVSRAACSDRHPRMARGVLVFVHAAPGDSAATCPPGVYVKRPGRAARRVTRRLPSSLDYRPGLIALGLLTTSAGPGPDRWVSEIRLLRPGATRSTLVARGRGRSAGTGQEGTELTDARLDGRFVYWRRSVRRASGSRRDDILRRRIAGGGSDAIDRRGRRWVGKPADTLASFAIDRGRIVYVYGSGIGRVPTTQPFQ